MVWVLGRLRVAVMRSAYSKDRKKAIFEEVSTEDPGDQAHL